MRPIWPWVIFTIWSRDIPMHCGIIKMWMRNRSTKNFALVWTIEKVFAWSMPRNTKRRWKYWSLLRMLPASIEIWAVITMDMPVWWWGIIHKPSLHLSESRTKGTIMWDFTWLRCIIKWAITTLPSPSWIRWVKKYLRTRFYGWKGSVISGRTLLIKPQKPIVWRSFRRIL